MTKPNLFSREIRCEFGHSLWLARQEKRLTLKQAARATNLPEHIIDGMELGRFVQYSALRRLMSFYGKTARIVFQ